MLDDPQRLKPPQHAALVHVSRWERVKPPQPTAFKPIKPLGAACIAEIRHFCACKPLGTG